MTLVPRPCGLEVCRAAHETNGSDPYLFGWKKALEPAAYPLAEIQQIEYRC
jgi:hypothetical protein